MNPVRPHFLSERVRVLPPLSADPLRYQYLNLQNAEPNFGIPSIDAQKAFDTYVITTDTNGNRYLLKTGTWDGTYTTLRTNSAEWLKQPTTDSLYLKLSGGTISGNLTVGGTLLATNLSAISAQFVTSVLTGLTSLSVQSFGYGPALYVSTFGPGGPFKIAEFNDQNTGVPVLVVNDAYNTGLGSVGINTSNPVTELAVIGSISASKLLFDGRYDSGQFGTAYDTVCALSARWTIGGLNYGSLQTFLSTNHILIERGTVLAGLSVNGGLSADRIVGVYQNNVSDAFLGNNVTSTFNLTQTIASVNDILVYVGGVYQDKATYSIISGPPSQIIFTEAPPAPDIPGEANIEVAYLKYSPLPIGVVADSSITTEKIANGAVTTPKLASVLSIDNLTVANNLSVIGSVSARHFYLENAVIPYQAFDVSPGQTTFVLASAVGSINDILVFVSGVYQRKDTYSLTNNFTLQLTTPPPVGTKIVEVSYLRYYPYTLSIPAPNTIITSSIADNAVTTVKIADGAVTSAKLANNISIIGDLTVFGNLTALGTSTQINTNISTTSALSVINVGTGPALVVRQTGPEPIAEFFDNESGPALWLANNGLVGVGTDTPTSTLTVAGDVSATNGYFQNSIRIDAKSNVNATLSAVTVFGVVSAQTLTTTNYALLVQINNQQFGVPLFNIS